MSVGSPRIRLERLNDETLVAARGHHHPQRRGGAHDPGAGTATPYRTDGGLIPVRNPNYETPPAPQKQDHQSRRPPLSHYNRRRPSAESAGFNGSPIRAGGGGSSTTKGPLRFFGARLEELRMSGGDTTRQGASSEADDIANSENMTNVTASSFRPPHGVTHASTPSKSAAAADYVHRPPPPVRPTLPSPVRHHVSPVADNRVRNMASNDHNFQGGVRSPSYHNEFNQQQHRRTVRVPDDNPLQRPAFSSPPLPPPARTWGPSAAISASRPARDMSPLMTRSESCSQSSPEKVGESCPKPAAVSNLSASNRHQNDRRGYRQEYDDGDRVDEEDGEETDDQRPPLSGLERSREPIVSNDNDEFNRRNVGSQLSRSRDAGGEHRNNENSMASGDATARSATTSGDDVFKVPAVPPAASAAAAPSKGKSKQKTRHLAASPESATNTHDDDLYEKAMYLKNWVPRLRKKKGLVIEGDVVDLGGFKGRDSDKVQEAEAKGVPWRSGSITGRPNPRLLESSSGRPYVLNGMIDIQTAEKGKVPPFIIQRFKNGFPNNWEAIVEQWKVFEAEQRSISSYEREETMTNYSCASCFVSINSTNAAANATTSNPDNLLRPLRVPERNTKRAENGRIQRSHDNAGTSQDDDEEEAVSPSKRSKPTQELEIAGGTVTTTDNDDDEEPATVRKNKRYRTELEALLSSVHADESASDGRQRRARGGKRSSLESNASSNVSRSKQRPAASKSRPRKGVTTEESEDEPPPPAPKKTENSGAHVKRANKPGPKSAKAKMAAKPVGRSSSVDSASTRLSASSSEDDRAPLKTKKVQKKPPANKTKKTPPKVKASKKEAANKKKDDRPLPEKATKTGNKKQQQQQQQRCDDNVSEEEQVVRKNGKNQKKVVAQPQAVVSLSELSKNPRTLKAMRKNTEILHYHSQDPNGDDYFAAAASSTKRGKTVAPPRAAVAGGGKKKHNTSKSGGGRNAAQIANDMFSSDDENDMMSMHSARTPIHSYLGVSSTVNTPYEDMPPDSAGGPAGSKSAKAVDQLVMRKMNEKRKLRRRTGPKQQQQLPAAAAGKSRRDVERDADQLVRPISKYLQSDHRGDSEDSDEMEEYFSEDEVGSLTNEPNGLVELASRKKKK